MTTDVYQELARVVVAFATTVREGNGIDAAEEAALRAALRQFAETTADLPTIPKSLAAVLVELFPALTGSAGLYDQSDAKRVEQLANELVDAVLEALSENAK